MHHVMLRSLVVDSSPVSVLYLGPPFILPVLADVHLSVQREVQVHPPVRLPLGDRGHLSVARDGFQHIVEGACGLLIFCRAHRVSVPYKSRAPCVYPLTLDLSVSLPLPGLDLALTNF